MHKLRKPTTPARDASSTGAMSRTMQLAVGGMKVSRDVSASLQREDTWFSAPLSAAPRTKVEQYWAARALVAETLLSARDEHQVELAGVRRMEEQKREREIGAILHASDQKQRRLERLMAMCLVAFLAFAVWLVMKITPERDAKGKPSHFTIPILSPFTSVVEHETGVFGTKAVVICVLAVGIAAYAALRHRWRTR